MEKREEVYVAALAGLLHDVGKFAQRAGAAGKHADVSAGLVEPEQLLADLIPPAWADDVGDAIAYHHGGDTHKWLTRVVRVADWLAASERAQMAQTKGQPETTPLIPLPSRVTLDPSKNCGVSAWGYPLNVDEAVCFPQQNVQLSGYPELWGKLTKGIRALPDPIHSFARMSGLLDVLAETTAYIPSATPWEANVDERTVPDVPLYQHLHLTAAIAVCLTQLDAELADTLYRAGYAVKDADVPVARLVKADFSGIQDFIYRITEPAADRSYRHTAKRLRARSLHLALLNQAVGEWLLQRLGLPPTQLLYAGGGIIEWLLPLNGDFQPLLCELEKALFAEPVFGGALGIVWADQELRPADFANVKEARTALESSLSQAKDRKASRLLTTEDFFKPKEIYHVCQVCGVTPVNEENQTCALCQSHEEAGGALPKSVALVQGAVPGQLGTPLQPASLTSPLDEIGGRLRLLEAGQKDELARLNKGLWEDDLLLRGINAFPQGMQRPDIIPGRWNIATAAPQVENEVWDFEEIANLSRGVPLLGVLKADADRMGLIFSRGIDPPTFSRTMALSATIHRFFGEYLDQLCWEMTTQWKAAAHNDRSLQEAFARRGVREWEKLDSIFYVLYAGGDDLFIVGPWDALIDFSLELRRKYCAYTCDNAAFSLSAGLIFIKPHVPIHQFAHLADKAEKKAKDAGRDRLAFWGQMQPWDKAEAMIAQGNHWVKEVEVDEMPRGLLHDLGYLFEGEVEVESLPVFTPTLYYTLVRRLQNHDRGQVQALGKLLLGQFPEILVALEYATLITRKE